ncbi:MAG: hypothetical protein ACR2QB_05965 [Gammaproteobacteria bacterium]
MRSTPALVCLCGLLSGAPMAAATDCPERSRLLMLASDPDVADVRSATAACEVAYANGDTSAAYYLGLLDLGLAAWKPERATSLISVAAQGGLPEAQYWLAWQLEEGPLLPNDPIRALQWYEDAAEQSHPLALARLADAYEAGELGLRPAPARAAELRALAASCAADNQ